MSYKKIGTIGVDSGMVVIGDPSYWDGEGPAKDWDEFTDRLERMKFDEKYGVEIDKGTGVVVHSGNGDGQYPVYIKVEDGMVAALMVRFDDEDPEDDDDDDEDIDDDDEDEEDSE